MNETIDNDTPQATSKTAMVIRAVIMICVLLAAVAVMMMLVKNPAQSEKKEAVAQDKRVSVDLISAESGDYPIKVSAMGQVIPANEVALKARVNGAIITAADAFVPGGIFAKGAEILTIDTADYDLALNMQQAAYNQAFASYKLEQGQQKIAAQELEILQQSTGREIEDTSLALRKPQLQQARATLKSAKAALDAAKLDVARTTLVAPFNALVTQRHNTVGNIVNTQDPIATLVDIDTYWIRVEMPVRDLARITIPTTPDMTGSEVIIDLGAGRGMRHGYVSKSTGQLDAQSRLATVLIAVDNPLNRPMLSPDMPEGDEGNETRDSVETPQKPSPNPKAAPLILNDFVTVTVIGETLRDAIRLPLSAIRAQNTIWVMEDDALAIRTAQIPYRDETYAYVTAGVQAGDRVVTSNILTPVTGMPLIHKGQPRDAEAQSTTRDTAPDTTAE